MKAQINNGIKYSSNYNIAFPNCEYIFSYPDKNDLFCIDKLIEVPVTCYKEFPIRKHWNCFQLSAASSREMRFASDFYNRSEINVITFLMHSFEFVKALDRQYTDFKPMDYLIQRFNNFCKYIYDNADRFQVVNFTHLDNYLKLNEINISDKKNDFYVSSPFLTCSRYFSHLISPHF